MEMMADSCETIGTALEYDDIFDIIDERLDLKKVAMMLQMLKNA